MITSMANGRIRQLQKWQKKKKAREEDGVFLVEGIRMAVEAPQEQTQPPAGLGTGLGWPQL